MGSECTYIGLQLQLLVWLGNDDGVGKRGSLVRLGTFWFWRIRLFMPLQLGSGKLALALGAGCALGHVWHLGCTSTKGRWRELRPITVGDDLSRKSLIKKEDGWKVLVVDRWIFEMGGAVRRTRKA